MVANEPPQNHPRGYGCVLRILRQRDDPQLKQKGGDRLPGREALGRVRSLVRGAGFLGCRCPLNRTGSVFAELFDCWVRILRAAETSGRIRKN